MKKVPFGIPLLAVNAPDQVWQKAIYAASFILAEARKRGEFQRISCDVIYLHLAELIRLRWDSKFKVKIPRDCLLQIRPSVEALNCLLDLSVELWTLTPGEYQHPAQLFMEVTVEGDCWGLFRMDAQGQTVTEVYRQIQAENGQLSRYENPFQKAASKKLFDVACDLAQRGGRFHTKTWKPYLRARKALAASTKPGGDVLIIRPGIDGKSKPTQVRKRLCKS